MCETNRNRKCAFQSFWNPPCSSYKETAVEAGEKQKGSKQASAGVRYMGTTSRTGINKHRYKYYDTKKSMQYPFPLSGPAKYNPYRTIAPRMTNAALRKYLKGRAVVGQKCWHSEIALSDNICRVAHSQPLFSIQPWQWIEASSLALSLSLPHTLQNVFFPPRINL